MLTGAGQKSQREYLKAGEDAFPASSEDVAHLNTVSEESPSDEEHSLSDAEAEQEQAVLRGSPAKEGDQSLDSKEDGDAEPKSYDFKAAEGRFTEEYAYQNSRKKGLAELSKR